jgi:hypothetical protein
VEANHYPLDDSVCNCTIDVGERITKGINNYLGHFSYLSGAEINGEDVELHKQAIKKAKAKVEVSGQARVRKC